MIDDLEPPRLARFLAFFVDYLLISVFAVALSAATGDVTVRRVDGRRIEEVSSPTWALAVYGVVVLVYATVSVAQWGRTPGMFAAGVAVERVTPDGENSAVSWGRSSVRAFIAMGWFAIPPVIPEDVANGSLSSVLSWAFFLWPIVVFAPILVDRGRRGLHDIAVGTRVVRRAATRSWAKGLPWARQLRG